jgi:hypothetical protein
MKKRYNVLNSASSPRGISLRRLNRAPSRTFRLGELVIRPGKQYPVNVDVLRKHKRELMAAVTVGTLEVRDGLRRLPMEELTALLASEEVVDRDVIPSNEEKPSDGGEKDDDDKDTDEDDTEEEESDPDEEEGGDPDVTETEEKTDPSDEVDPESKLEDQKPVERKTLPEGWENFNKTDLIGLAKELGMDPGDDTKKVLIEKVKQYAAS